MKEINARIIEIKKELQKLGDLRPGSITKQYAKPKEKKGAFFQISYTHKMKSKSDYVKKDFVKEMEKQLEEYKKLKSLVEEWIDLGIKKSKMMMKTKTWDREKNE
jgi:hypothetical protein